VFKVHVARVAFAGTLVMSGTTAISLIQEVSAKVVFPNIIFVFKGKKENKYCGGCKSRRFFSRVLNFPLLWSPEPDAKNHFQVPQHFPIQVTFQHNCLNIQEPKSFFEGARHKMVICSLTYRFPSSTVCHYHPVSLNWRQAYKTGTQNSTSALFSWRQAFSSTSFGPFFALFMRF
jgi:hypothetical protein